MKFDLHLHSYYSDGRLSPAELLDECKKANLQVIALTDHESVKGVQEALTGGEKLGIKVIPGIEFAITDQDNLEQHFLGLFIDYKNPQLAEFLGKNQKTKMEQIKQMVRKLQTMKFRIKLKDVLSEAKGSVNRSHIGYAVLHNPRNKEILKHYGIASVSDFFEVFLKKRAYKERKRPGPAEAIKLIKSIGGLTIWAHPMWQNREKKVLEEKAVVFKEMGLAGLEVAYPAPFMDREMTLLLHGIAQKLQLLETAGSDFHSFDMPKFNKLADFDTLGLELNLPPALKK